MDLAVFLSWQMFFPTPADPGNVKNKHFITAKWSAAFPHGQASRARRMKRDNRGAGMWAFSLERSYLCLPTGVKGLDERGRS